MSEGTASAVAEAPEAGTQSQAPAQSAQPTGGFLGGQSQQAEAATSTPQYVFADSFHKEGKFNEGWTQSLSEKYPSLAGKLSTAKDQEGALSILNNAVQVAGRREIRGAPDETWQPHEVAEFRRAHGVPEQPSEYSFAPTKPPEGQHWDGEAVKGFEGLMHKHNIPKAFAEEAREFYSGILSKQTEHGLGEFQRQLDEANKATHAWAEKEWGPEYEQRFDAWQSFVDTKISKEDQAKPGVQIALRNPAIVEMIDMARESIREGTIPGTTQSVSSGSMNPKQQYETLMQQNPDWQTNPAKAPIAKRITELANLQAAQDKRKR